LNVSGMVDVPPEVWKATKGANPPMLNCSGSVSGSISVIFVGVRVAGSRQPSSAM